MKLRLASRFAIRPWFLVFLMGAAPAGVFGAPFRCAGVTGATMQIRTGAAKRLAPSAPRPVAAVVIFAHFADQDLPDTPPSWSTGLLDPDLPGSVAHFYDSMSFGQLRLRGRIVPRRYVAPQPAGAYLATVPGEPGQYGRFALDILRRADADIDFRPFDNDGPDGRPDSGDDDGVVDMVFINIASAPAQFVLRDATGIAALGFEDLFISDDVGAGGTPIRIDPTRGTLQAAPDLPQAAGAMAHEYGHILGLPDLYNVEWTKGLSGPEQDSAGIGRWGLMGWGARGWPGAPGPTSLSAWSRLRLGWAQVVEPDLIETPVRLAPVTRAGQMSRVMLSGTEYFLLEYRRRDSSHYDRGIPGEGLLIWHVRRAEVEGELAPWWDVDLETADGRWQDAGYPLGTEPAPRTGSDNLDFWAHDSAYAEAHGGNLGDATDPFDGVMFDRFTAATNPAAVSRDGANSVSIEQITVDGDQASFLVRRGPPVLVLTDVTPRNQRVAAGSPMAVTFQLANTGSTPATNLRAVLRSNDGIVEILTPEIGLLPLPVGASSVGRGVSLAGFPRLRFPQDLAREETVTVELVIYAGATPVAAASVQVTGVPAHRVVTTVTGAQGTPLPDIDVSLRADDATAAFYVDRILSDSAGVAVFHVPTGSYELQVEPDREGPWGDSQLRGLWIEADASFDLVLPRVFLLRGVVRDAAGDPVAQHYVVIERSAAPTYWGRSVRTDPQGAYSIRLPAGTYSVSTRSYSSSASAPPQEHGQVEVSRNTVLDLELERGVTLSVDVVNVDGTHVDSVWIDVRAAAEAYSFPVAGARTARGKGAELEVLPGTYTLSVRDVAPPNVAPHQVTTVDVFTDTSVILLLQRGVRVTARLVDESGRLLELPSGRLNPVNVTFSSPDLPRDYLGTLTSGAAELALGVLPGVYDVELQAFSSPSDADLGFPSQPLGTVEILGDTTLSLAVSAGVLLSGQIIGRRGATTHSSLSLRAASGSWASGWLQADGRFTLRLLPDEYFAFVYFSGASESGATAPSQSLGSVQVTQDTTVIWRLMEDELVEGRIVDLTGAAVPDLSVYASANAGDRTVSNSSRTRQDGSFDIRLPAGTYVMRSTRYVTGGTSVTWRLRDLDVPALTAPVFIFPGGATLTPRITDGAGQHLPARLQVHAGDFSLGDYVRQIRDGAAMVDARIETDGPLDLDLAPGRYFAVISPLAASNPTFSRVVASLIAAGRSKLDVALAEPAAGPTLRGAIRQADGSSVPYSTLYAFAPGLSLLASTPVPGGEYEMSLPAGTYHLALRSSTPTGSSLSYEQGPVEIFADRTLDIVLGTGTAVAELETTPDRFSLAQNYPNPFNAYTVIDYATGTDGPVEIVVFGLLGQRVRTLVSGPRRAGPGQVPWDGTNDSGRAVASGLYLYRLVAQDRILTRKMLLLR